MKHICEVDNGSSITKILLALVEPILEIIEVTNLTLFPSISVRAYRCRETITWEQCKLGDIAEIVGGGTPSTSNSSYWDGDIDWYAPAEMEGQR